MGNSDHGGVEVKISCEMAARKESSTSSSSLLLAVVELYIKGRVIEHK